jgi:hypothetical protein
MEGFGSHVATSKSALPEKMAKEPRTAITIVPPERVLIARKTGGWQGEKMLGHILVTRHTSNTVCRHTC